MNKLLMTIGVIVCLSTPVKAEEDIHAFYNNINTAMMSISTNTNLQQAVKTLHTSFNDNAKFVLQIHNHVQESKNQYNLDKSQYINSFISGQSTVENYQVTTKVESYVDDIAKIKMTETGNVGSVNFTSVTECINQHKNGQIVLSVCKTNVTKNEEI